MINMSVSEKVNLMKSLSNIVRDIRDGANTEACSKALSLFEELAIVIGSDEDTTIDIFNRAAANKFVPSAHPFETVYSDARRGILVTIAAVNANKKEMYVAKVTIVGDITALTVKANSLDEIKNVLLANGVDLDSMRKER